MVYTDWFSHLQAKHEQFNKPFITINHKCRLDNWRAQILAKNKSYRVRNLATTR